MRTVSSKTISGASRTATTPIFFVELRLSTTLRLCTYDTLPWNGFTWTANGIEVVRLNPESAEIAIPNLDGAIGSVVLGGLVRDKPAKIWKVYGEPPFAAGDPVPVFSGFVNTVPPFRHRVVLTLTAYSSGAAFFPRKIVSPPVFNHLPKPGSERTVNGEKFILPDRG